MSSYKEQQIESCLGVMRDGAIKLWKSPYRTANMKSGDERHIIHLRGQEAKPTLLDRIYKKIRPTYIIKKEFRLQLSYDSEYYSGTRLGGFADFVSPPGWLQGHTAKVELSGPDDQTLEWYSFLLSYYNRTSWEFRGTSLAKWVSWFMTNSDASSTLWSVSNGIKHICTSLDLHS